MTLCFIINLIVYLIYLMLILSNLTLYDYFTVNIFISQLHNLLYNTFFHICFFYYLKKKSLLILTIITVMEAVMANFYIYTYMFLFFHI